MYSLKLPAPPHKRLVLTTALPYANGPLHIGHMTEAIQACAFARYRRLTGQDVMFLGADDAHGTAIEIAAEDRGISPERYIAGIRQDHIQSYAAFDISYDAFHSTHSEENSALLTLVYERLLEGGHLEEREVRQLFDLVAGRALEDRRVKGTCPECGKPDQNGDSCECGATYDATALVNPVSTMSGESPVKISAQHLFFKLAKAQPEVEDWLAKGPLQPSMLAKVQEWLDESLRDWCITRSGPYFGFPVPDRRDLYFYVWVDAPLGYIATLQSALPEEDALTVWNAPDTEIVHIIGKDIINFHAVFWPAILKSAGLAQPTRVHAHGFVNVGGQKMSKSRGNVVLAKDLAATTPMEAIRWAIAGRLGPGVVDIDFEAGAVADKVNSDLAGKVANIAARLGSFQGRIDGKLGATLTDPTSYQTTLDQATNVLSAFEAINLAEAVRGIIRIADGINRDIAEAAPWNVSTSDELRRILTDALSRFRVLAALLQPIVPDLAARALGIFGEQELNWIDLTQPPLSNHIAIPPKLFDRISTDSLSALKPTTDPTIPEAN